MIKSFYTLLQSSFRGEPPVELIEFSKEVVLFLNREIASVKQVPDTWQFSSDLIAKAKFCKFEACRDVSSEQLDCSMTS